MEVVNDCLPTCVAGHAHRNQATVTMSKPIRCPGHKHRVFDRLTVRFKGKTGAHSTHTSGSAARSDQRSTDCRA